MQLHVQALYHHDETLRLTSINDRQGGVAPRFFLGRTDRGNVWRFRNDVSRDICEALEAVCQAEPLAPSEQPAHAAVLQHILSAHARIATTWRGPAYWFPYEAAPALHVVLIDEQSVPLLEGGLSD